MKSDKVGVALIEDSYANICPDFKWIYCYEDSRDEWVTKSCHYCLFLDESCLPDHIVKDDEMINYRCQIKERETKHNNWKQSKVKGQQHF